MSILRLLDVAVIVTAVAWLAFAVLRGNRGVANPYLWFLLGTSIFLNLGSLRDWVEGVSHDPAVELDFHVLELAHLLVVYLAFLVTSAFFTRRRNASPGPRRHLSPRRLALVVLAALAAKLLFANPLGGFQANVSNYARLLAMMAPAAACLLVALFHESSGANGGRLISWRGTLTLLAVIVLAFQQSRTPLLYALFVVYMYVVWREQAKRRAALLRRLGLLYVLPAIVVVAIGLGSLVKGYSSIVTFNASREQARRVVDQQAEHLGFIDAYENGLFVLETYPKLFGYRYGESLGSLFLGPVPRSVWPGKPLSFSYYMTRAKYGDAVDSTGLSLAPSLLGDMWGGGGWPSVLLESIVLGVFMAFMLGWYLRRQDNIVDRVVYWEFLFMMLLSARGDIYTIFERGLVFIVFTLLLANLSGAGAASPGRSRRRSLGEGVAGRGVPGSRAA